MYNFWQCQLLARQEKRVKNPVALDGCLKEAIKKKINNSRRENKQTEPQKSSCKEIKLLHTEVETLCFAV